MVGGSDDNRLLETSKSAKDRSLPIEYGSSVRLFSASLSTYDQKDIQVQCKVQYHDNYNTTNMDQLYL